MVTEQDIIYTMLEALKGGELNNDEPIGERLLRNFLKKHRPDILRKHYRNGLNVDPEVFQIIPLNLLSAPLNNTNNAVTSDTAFSKIEFFAEIPKLIRFINDTGFYIEKDGYGIPILEPMEYRVERRNFNTKFQPKAKTIGNIIYLYIGDKESNFIVENSETWSLINSLENSINTDGRDNLNIDFHGVLMNPDDAPGYNWKTDIYPFPAERINELCNQIYSKEFGVIIQAKPDEIQNARPDKIVYHQNDDVNRN